MFLSMTAAGWFLSALLGSPSHAQTDTATLKQIQQSCSNMQDLYVFRPRNNDDPDTEEDESETPTDENVVIIALTMNPHVGKLQPSELFSSRLKYTVYISTDDDYTEDYKIDVYFGGADQYAVFLNSTENPIGGKIGQYVVVDDVKVFAGTRADPRFFDSVGYSNFLADKCSPSLGFRCTAGEEPSFEDDYNGNIGSIILEIPTEQITGNSDVKKTQLRIWAKAFWRSS